VLEAPIAAFDNTYNCKKRKYDHFSEKSISFYEFDWEQAIVKTKVSCITFDRFIAMHAYICIEHYIILVSF
jgi:hypothetical protein